MQTDTLDRPAMQVLIANPELARGERLRGELLLPKTANAEPQWTLRVGWHTEGRGDTDQGHAQLWQLETLPRVGSLEGDRYRFETEIPSDAPASYDGKLIRVIWSVSLERAAKRRLAKPEVLLRGEFRVS